MPVDPSGHNIPPSVRWWLRGEGRQNFGDFLSLLLWTGLSSGGAVEARSLHLVGSVITEGWIKKGLAGQDGTGSGRVAFWCCGCPEPKRPSEQLLAHAQICGVRGPLTRQVLGLPMDTVMGDPGLLAPLLHQPAAHIATQGKTICVPHISDPLTDVQLLHLTGADAVVRPAVEGSTGSLRELLDKIASARFVLAGSMHAAIVAFSYGVPFSYLDSGFLSMPFKWRDFSASVNIGTHFVDNVADGWTVYRLFIAPRMRRPSLLRILGIAPFPVRPDMLQAAEAWDKRWS